MFAAVEVLVGQQVTDAVPGAVVEQQAAQYAGLPFNRMGWNTKLGNLAVGAVTGVSVQDPNAVPKGGKNGERRPDERKRGT